MRRKKTLVAALATGATALLTLGATAAGASASVSTGHGPSSRPLPYQVFAPYYEMYDTSTDLATLSQQSGARYLSLAFLQTDTSGSCTAYWDGDTTTPIAASSFGSDIAEIQRHGGNVIPSFGGYTADTTNTEIADSCTSVPAIAAGVREPHHHLQRAAHRPGRRSRLAHQHRRDQPAQRGDRDDGGVGGGASPAASSSPTRCRRSRLA